MIHSKHLASAAAVLLLLTGSAAAQKLLTPLNGGDQPVSLQTPRAQAGFEDVRPVGKPISLGASGGTLIRLPRPARTVFVADSNIADVQVQGEKAEFVYVTAKKPGTTVIYAVDNKGDMMMNVALQVQPIPVTIIRRGKVESSGEPEPGPIVLQIPLTPAPAPATGR